MLSSLAIAAYYLQAFCTPVRCVLLVFGLSRSVSPSLVLTLSHSLFVSFQTQYPSLSPPVSIPPPTLSLSLHSPSPLSLSSRRTPAARRTRSCGEGGVEGRGKTKRLRRQRKRGERHSSPPRAAPPHRSRQSPLVPTANAPAAVRRLPTQARCPRRAQVAPNLPRAAAAGQPRKRSGASAQARASSPHAHACAAELQVQPLEEGVE